MKSWNAVVILITNSLTQKARKLVNRLSDKTGLHKIIKKLFLIEMTEKGNYVSQLFGN